MAVKIDTIELMVAIVAFKSEFDFSFESFVGSLVTLTLNSDEFSIEVEDGVDVDGLTSMVVSRCALVVKMVAVVVGDVSINLITEVVDGDLDVFLLVVRTVMIL
jgi:hypothetical protein